MKKVSRFRLEAAIEFRVFEIMKRHGYDILDCDRGDLEHVLGVESARLFQNGEQLEILADNLRVLVSKSPLCADLWAEEKSNGPDWGKRPPTKQEKEDDKKAEKPPVTDREKGGSGIAGGE